VSDPVISSDLITNLQTLGYSDDQIKFVLNGLIGFTPGSPDSLISLFDEFSIQQDTISSDGTCEEFNQTDDEGSFYLYQRVFIFIYSLSAI